MSKDKDKDKDYEQDYEQELPTVKLSTYRFACVLCVFCVLHLKLFLVS